MSTDTKKHTGVVKWYGTADRHYGFISPDDGSKEMFVHISAVSKAGLRGLEEGDRLEFTVEIDKKNGRQVAANLRLI